MSGKPKPSQHSNASSAKGPTHSNASSAQGPNEVSKKTMRRVKLGAAAVGVILAILAPYLGFDFFGNNDDSNTGSTASSESSASTASPASSRVASTNASGAGQSANSGDKNAASTDSSADSAGHAFVGGQGGQNKQNGSIPDCSVRTLPNQAEVVVKDIQAGGPFDYPDKDGSHFGNYQNVLPKQKSSYYREYTVDEDLTDNSRGAKRIITGGGSDTHPDVWYYTDDHYETFCKITDAAN